MANLNRVMLMGNLTRDPEMRHTQTGASVVEFGIAINETWKDKNTGEKREKTCFVDCKAWGRVGEVINEYMSKGRSIYVEGNLDFEQWEQEGQKRSKLKVNVTSFQFIDGKGDAQQSGGGGQHQTQRQQPTGQQSFAGGGNDSFGDVPF